MTTKIVLVDGLQVETTEAGAAAIAKLQNDVANVTALRVAADTTIGKLTADLSTKDGEIAALKSQVADAALTPAKLDAAVAARSAVVDTARKIKADLVTDGKTEIEIMRGAVAFKLGDAIAAGFNDDAIKGAFGTLSIAGAGSPAPVVTGGSLRTGLINMDATAVADAKAKADDAWKKANERTASAHRGTAAA